MPAPLTYEQAALEAAKRIEKEPFTKEHIDKWDCAPEARLLARTAWMEGYIVGRMQQGKE